MIGTILRSRYELTGLVSDAPIFATYSARDRQSGRDVAVRVLKPPFYRDQVFIDRLKGAVVKYRSFHSANVEAINDVEQDDQLAFIVGELTRGPSLADRIRKLAPFSIQVAVGTAMSLCMAVEGLHKVKSAHGDLNPTNIAVLADGDVRVQLTGIWEAYSGSATAAAMILPTMSPYLAPDVSGGSMPSPRSDVYSIGVILFELLSGRLPYYAETPSAMALQHATKATPSVRSVNPSVPMVLDEIIKKAMSKEPALRYASSVELLADLRLLQDALRFGKQLTWPLRAAVANTANSQIPTRSTSNRSATSKVKATAQPQRVAPRMSAIRTDQEYEDRPRKQRVERDVPVWMMMLATFFVALAASLVIFFIFSNMQKPRMVTVPDVKGLSLAEARAVLKESKLQVRIGGKQSNDRIDIDHVLSLDRDPGEKIPEGSTIGIVVSTGSRNVTVPDLRGLTIDKAKTLLGSLNLTMDDQVDHIADNQIGDGLIVRSKPTAKELVDRQSLVHVIVSTGPNGAVGGVAGQDPSNPTGTDSQATVSPEVSPSDPASNLDAKGKESVYTLRVRMNHITKPTEVKIDVTDDRGTRTIERSTRNPDDNFAVSAKGYGDQAIFRFYYDGQLVRTLTKKASGEQIDQ